MESQLSFYFNIGLGLEEFLLNQSRRKKANPNPAFLFSILVLRHAGKGLELVSVFVGTFRNIPLYLTFEIDRPCERICFGGLDDFYSFIGTEVVIRTVVYPSDIECTVHSHPTPGGIPLGSFLITGGGNKDLELRTGTITAGNGDGDTERNEGLAVLTLFLYCRIADDSACCDIAFNHITRYFGELFV